MTFLDTPPRSSLPWHGYAAPRQTERAFQAQVLRYAALMGWRSYHTLRSTGSPAGFPDLVLVRARPPVPRLVFAEIKTDRGRITTAQRAWIDELRACGQEAYIWRPAAFPCIERLLR